jgi:aminomethyltransferase
MPLHQHGGGLLDDLTIARSGDYLLLVVNAACKAADEAHLRARLGNESEVEPLNRALIAPRGRKEAALSLLAPEASACGSWMWEPWT